MLTNRAPNASTLATFVLPIARALRLQGEDPMQILELAGIDPASVINADRRISITKMQRLWELSLERTGQEAFGLLAAEQVQATTLQGLGLAFLSSDTVYDALKRLVRFCKVISTGLDLQLVEQGEYIDLEFRVPLTRLEQDFQFAALDFGMGMIMKMCQLTLGEYMSPIHADLQRPVPRDPGRFASLLGCKLSFDEELYRIRFVRADIIDRLVTANSELARINDDQVKGYLASFLDSSTSQEVVCRIVEELSEGLPSQSRIADALNMSSRTLQRKLKEEGCSFSDLVQDTRLQLAKKYLAQPHRSVVEIAYMLGFSEPSTFSRAFKRWTGQSPAEFRANSH
jgi:AraC-like DNA-binding protein